MYDPTWNTNKKQDKAATYLKSWTESQNIPNLTCEILKDDDKTPLIYININPISNHQNNFETSNIVIYGHFDKQPHLPGWFDGLGPLKPTIINNKLYGRGAADDGYSIFSSIIAIKSLLKANPKQNHGRIQIIIEGSEESGSIHLNYYINKLKEKIGNVDLFICLDSGCKDYERLWITESLRGQIKFEINVETAVNYFSEMALGVTPQPFMIMRNLVDRIENSKNGQINELFQVVDIPDEVIRKTKFFSSFLKFDEIIQFNLHHNTKSLTEDKAELILNNTWRPALTLTGISELINLNSPIMTFKFSLRLPPTFDSEKGAKIFEELLLKNPPFNAKISLSNVTCGNGLYINKFSEKLLNILNKASLKYFNNKPETYGEGGSIPFMNSFVSMYPNAEMLILGVLGKESNAHCPNESLDLLYCRKLTCILSEIIKNY